MRNIVLNLSILSALLLVISSYITHRLIAWSGAVGPFKYSLITIMAMISLTMLLHYALHAYNLFNLENSTIFHWASYIVMGLFACLLAYTVSIDFISLIWIKFSSSVEHVDLGRRNFLLTAGLSLGTTLLGVGQAVLGPKIKHVSIPIANLPPELEGFKIIQISDLHVGPTIGRAYVEEVVRKANEHEPHLVALTGDFIDGYVPQLATGVAPLENLKSTHGTFYVTGNHEYYWGAYEWIEEFKRLGIRPLLNEHVVLTEKGKEVVVAGVTDHSAERFLPLHSTDPVKAMANAPRAAVRILLAHQPISLERSIKTGIDLQLSGHTHGGQFFPWSIAVMFAQRYLKGLYRKEDTWIYVNPGTGYWGPPLRFAVPSEITLLKLTREV